MNDTRHAAAGRRTLRKWLPPIRGQAIFLLRHGAIQHRSAPRRFIGQTDLPLNDRGRRQAHYWRACLAHATVAGICCSDLCRCTETARIAVPGEPPPVRAVPAMREIDLGQWDGLSFERVRRQWPDAFRQRGQDIAGFRPPDGESFTDLHQRVIPAFEEMVGRTDGNLLIVAHAGVNRVILCHLLGMPLGHLFRISQCPGAMNVIDRRADGYRVLRMNLPPQIDCTGV
jgi:probable phosphoglycerate mutase